MEINLEVLSDNEYQTLAKNNLEEFLDPIKRQPRTYSMYHKILGNKSINDFVVQRNLPPIATKLYLKRDNSYVEIMGRIADEVASTLVNDINTLYEGDLTQEEIIKFSNQDIEKIIGYLKDRYKEGFDYELLWIQLKLIGLPDIDKRKSEITLLCGDASNTLDFADASSLEADNPKSQNNKSEKEHNEKRIKPKKLTPEEKAAKTKAANEAKEKAKTIELETPIDEINGESDDLDETVKESDYDEYETDQYIDYIEEAELDKKVNNTIKEKNKMRKYIGIISIKGVFYNFLPIGYYEDGMFYSYSEHELDDLLPLSKLHNINFAYKFDRDGDGEGKQMSDMFLEDMLYLLDYDLDELEENRQSDGSLNPTGYKINNAVTLWNKNISLLSLTGLYRLIPKSALIDDIGLKKIIRVNYELYDNDLFDGESVLVNLGDGFYAGPYKVKKHTSDGGSMMINIQAVEGKFFTSGYASSDCTKIVISPSYDVEKWIGYKTWTYYRINNDAKQLYKDIISDRLLLDSFKSSLEKEDAVDYNNLSIENIIDDLDMSQIIGDKIPEEIRENRKDRIKEIMSSEDELSTLYSDTYDIICDLLLNNKDSEPTEKLLNGIINKRPDLLDKMQGVKSIQTKIDYLMADIERLEQQRKEIEIQIFEKERLKASEKESREKEIDFELAEKEKLLNELNSRVEVATTLVELNNKISSYKEEELYYQKRNEYLKTETRSLEKEFVDLVDRNSQKIADIAFDGFMSSKMLKAAAEWESKEDKGKLEEIVESINTYQTEKLAKDQLIDYLVSSVQCYRPGYSRNTIINIIACLAQGFLTVFSGAPGCGKTSICNILSKVMGLNSYKNVSPELKNIKRYITVSVERGWSSKRDFIGYYNPLTKAFEENNKEVFEGLRILDMESKKNFQKYPFIILLDEANLSPMEYYWADFMNICDDPGDNSTINLGNENVLQIPETLHFVATINNDHTTETLSPRLIDRAWIISLPRVGSLMNGTGMPEESMKNITWEEIKNVFTTSGYSYKEFDRETKSIYDGIKERLLKQGIYISPRIDLAIQGFWIVCSQLMKEDEYGNDPSRIALDYAVAQKVLPKITGSGDEFETFLEELKSYCDNNGLPVSTNQLASIIGRGKSQMKYFQFFS